MLYARSNRIDPTATARQPSPWARLIRRLLRSEGAAISPMFALLLIPISGSIAYAVELGGMQYVQRSMQNAADAAALAAATNNSEIGTTFLMEARAAARPYGYIDGEDDATVNAEKLDACPAGTPGTDPVCYEAVITSSFPLSISRVVGFFGTDGSGSQLIVSRAIANANGGSGGGGPKPACLWALGNTGITLEGNGIPFADLSGCGIISAGSINCTGGNAQNNANQTRGMNADFALAGSGATSEGCAGDEAGDISYGDPAWVSAPTDPYAQLSPPAAPSGTTCQNNTIEGDIASTFLYFCGDVKIAKNKNVRLTGTNTVMVIKNGTLDLNGQTLETYGANASTTIIFTGDNTATKQHYPTSQTSGFLKIRAPTDGTWADIALYQDPTIQNKVYQGQKYTRDFVYAGNSPTWDISGVAYFPGAGTEFKGIVGKYEADVSCFILIASKILISGTGQIIADNTTEDCKDAGYSVPEVTLPGTTRPKLVS